MTKKYKNSPLVEVLCEFQFIPKEQWDATMPGVFYQKIKRDFPVKKERKPLIMLDETTNEKQKGKFISLTQFYNKKEDSLIQVGKNMLTINCLKPYPHWEKFKPLINDNLSIFRKTNNPNSIRKIILTYINRINIPLEQINLEDYFNFYPQTPKKFGKTMRSIDSIIQIPYCDNRDLLTLRIANAVPEKENKISMLLQLDYAINEAESISFNEIGKWLENAHTIIKNVFELSITNKCRTLFKK